MYEMRVITNYQNKSVDYEQIMGDKVTAENRLAYRVRRECNAMAGTGQGYHKNSKTPKKRVTVKTTTPRSINVTSNIGQ